MKKSIIVSILCLMTLMGLAQSVNTYQYDQLDRLKKTNYVNGTVTQYNYDALGRRTNKQVAGVPVNCIIAAATQPGNGGIVIGSGTFQGGDTCTMTATANNGYTFVNWTENGSVVSYNATYSFIVTRGRTLVANFKVKDNTGALDGVFSVSDSTFVVFSKGNLLYHRDSCIWRFAATQYERREEGCVYLFGWGTSGYNHGAVCYLPESQSENASDYYAYGSVDYNLYDQTGQADWGYNAISNGGNTTNTWRTLSKEEWEYLFSTRNTISGIRFAIGNVNGVNGAILLPDDWNSSLYTLNNPNGGNYNSNTISLDQWNNLEQHGAVFLPTVGYRTGNSVHGFTYNGLYWSSTAKSIYSNDDAYGFAFGNGVGLSSTSPRSYGAAVRLVRSAEIRSFEINATPYPMEGGTVNGSGTYQGGSAITLTATPNAGYYFLNWTENGKVVSTAATDRFYVNGKRTLVANFSQVGGTGVLKGVFSVGENSWVNFSQGNLQYQASSNTWRFATNQYDYIGEDNKNISSTYTGWIDLFGWGTSGYDHGAVCYQPWSTSEVDSNYWAYGYYKYYLYDQTGMADWGYNAISNGGDTINTWRTLTKDEWRYILYYRNTSSGIRFAMANVNEVNGLILLPDDWDESYYLLNETNTDNTYYNRNILTAAQWAVLELHGAVFLPAAGYRDGTVLHRLNDAASYASSSLLYYDNTTDNSYAICLVFWGGFLTPYGVDRSSGNSVRLVRPAQNVTFSINATSNASECGMVSNPDDKTIYHYGETATLIANANAGYAFLNWTKDGEVVSVHPNYSFTVTENASFVANFVDEGSLCHVVFDIYDRHSSYGRSTLVVTDASGTSQQFDVGRDTSATYTLPVPTGTHLTLTLIKSDETFNYNLNVSYPNSYVIYSGNNLNDNFSFEFDVDCMNSLFTTHTINATADPVEGGTITGYGEFVSGQTCSLMATPNEGYMFRNWSCNGEIVSTNLSYSFIVTEDLNFVANFEFVGGIVIGSGDAFNCYLPSDSRYNYSLTQQIYTAEEMGSAGVITGIAFFNNSHAEATRIYDFYMKTTEKATFSDKTDWEVVTDADKVFSGEVTMIGNDWTYITFTHPFIYDGVSNVVLVADDNSGTNTILSRLYCRVFDAPNQAIYVCNDNTDFNPLSPPTSSFSAHAMLSVKNQVILKKDPLSDCIRPSHLIATEVGPDFVKLNWIENGISEQWYVVCGDRSVVANINEDFILDGLEPETEYTIRVYPDCDENLMSNAITITTLDACPVPQEVEVGNITGKTATVTWIGYSNSYNVMYRTAAYIDGMEETFDATSAPTGWTRYSGALNNDGTGPTGASYGWSFGTNQFSSSHAYMNIYSTNNYWLVTPSISVGSDFTLSFNAAYTKYNSTDAPQTNGTDDRFLVLISTDEKAHWTILKEWNNSGSTYVLNNLPVTFQPVAPIDLSAYAGQTVYIAFYGASTESNADNTLRIDDVSIGHFVEAGAWQIGTVEESPCHLTGLSPETLYEVKVQGDCGSEGLSDETEVITFWTLEACPAPSIVSVTNIGGNIATVNWIGDSDSYTVSYREANTFKEDFESETSFANWTFVSMNTANAIGTSNGAGRLAVAAHSDSYGFRFSSYSSKQSSETYDQYLISPELTVTGELKFYYKKTNSSVENLYVGYSSTTSDLEAFTWSNDVVPTQDWQNYTQDLPADVKYIAFHYFGNYSYYVYVDDITIGVCEIPGSDWYTVTTTNGATTVNLTGLTPSTHYEVMVQGFCDGTETNWSEMATFTTEELTTVAQTVELHAGTNWFSTYLDITLEDLQNALNAALPGATSITIKSKNSSCRWNGTIWRAANGFVWDVAKMYMIEVPEACELTLNGTPFNPAEHPITIAPNTSTWIGFPFSESKTFDQAIPAGFAVSGDQIKYQNAIARYINGTWRGSGTFNGFEPGKGYMYNSVSSGERTLIFPSGAK